MVKNTLFHFWGLLNFCFCRLADVAIPKVSTILRNRTKRVAATFLSALADSAANRVGLNLFYPDISDRVLGNIFKFRLPEGPER